MDTFHILNFHAIFSENAFCLSQRLGIDIVYNFAPIDGHTYLLFGAHDQAITLYTLQQENKKIKYIIINTEPPQSNHLRNKYFIQLMKNNIVFDYHDISKQHLGSLGIRVFSNYFPEFVYNNSEEKRDIDILFVGSRNARREAIFEKLKLKYPEKKIVFEMDWKHSDQTAMKKLLQSAKIVLNIPFYNSGILETHRIHSALACGCEVASLYSGHKETDSFYEPYIHFCHDLFELFDDKEVPKLKLKYPHMISRLYHNLSHNKWVLEQLLKNK
jgi:hypothetical protein